MASFLLTMLISRLQLNLNLIYMCHLLPYYLLPYICGLFSLTSLPSNFYQMLTPQFWLVNFNFWSVRHLKMTSPLIQNRYVTNVDDWLSFVKISTFQYEHQGNYLREMLKSIPRNEYFSQDFVGPLYWLKMTFLPQNWPVYLTFSESTPQN